MVRARARDLERFQSTLPVGESDDATECIKYIATDFNPRSPRGERPGTVEEDILSTLISIHALRGESDSKHIQNAAWRFG